MENFKNSLIIIEENINIKGNEYDKVLYRGDTFYIGWYECEEMEGIYDKNLVRVDFNHDIYDYENMFFKEDIDN